MRTGDLGRLTPDGSLEVLGRVEDHVWISGRPVHTKQVEAELARYPDVQDVAVVARTPPEGPRLTAHPVMRSGAAWEPRLLMRHARVVLEPHCVPVSWIRLAAIPRLANGKLDRQALLSGTGVQTARPVRTFTDTAWFRQPDWS